MPRRIVKWGENMKQIDYSITLLSHTVLADKINDKNTVSTKEYLPGNVLLGVLASHYLQKNKRIADDMFKNLFLKNNVFFRNAYISNVNNAKTVFSPMYIQKAKSEDKYFFFPLMTNEEKKDYPHIKPLLKYVSIDKTGNVSQFEIKKGNHFHINTYSESVEDSVFHYEYLQADQVFRGSILCKDEFYDTFEKLLNETKTIHIGRSKNTEYGKAQFTFKPSDNPTKINDYVENNKVYFYCKSPIILRNSVGSYVSSVNLLKEYLPFAKDSYEIESPCTKITEVENIKGIWKMKMPLAKAFAMGSSFTLHFKEKPTENTLTQLQDIIANGVGCRTNEGYGDIGLLNFKTSEIIISKETKTTLQKNISSTETKYIPTYMKNVLKKMYLNEMEKNISLMVMEKSNEFLRESLNNSKRLPTSSLLAKLERIVDNCDSIEYFIGTIKKANEKEDEKGKIKKHARKQLKNCQDKDQSLYDFLLNTFNYTIKPQTKWRTLLQEEKILSDFEIQKRYISKLMIRLRKLNKEDNTGVQNEKNN
jgi:CRISPR-associated protein Csx10